MNERQRAFLDELAERIPRLFEAISAGNVRAEFIVGLRRVGRRNVRLKLVAEVIDPGANPLGTHGAAPTASSAPIVELRLEAIPAGVRERKAADRARRNSDPPPDEPDFLRRSDGDPSERVRTPSGRRQPRRRR